MLSTVMSNVAPTPWLVCHKRNPQAKTLLFCFPYAGGTALIYRKWQDYLPASMEVCPVQLPGRGNRLHETPFTQLLPLAETIAEVISPYLDKPFTFFGHSMGATIAFEVARILRRESDREPAHLFVSGRRAPQVINPEPPIHNLPEPELLVQLRQLNGTPPEVLEHPELMQVMLPLLRADFSVAETYTYKAEPPLSCPITAFGGLQDMHVERESLEAWREQTTAPFILRMLAGDHFFLNTSQPLLLRALAQELHRVERMNL